MASVAVAVCFALMGVVALVAPDRVVRLFGTDSLGRDGRNEVRAVYGGYGIATSILLLGWPELRLAVAVALAGMAAGRLVSGLLDRGLGRIPFLFLALELGLGAALLLPA